MAWKERVVEVKWIGACLMAAVLAGSFPCGFAVAQDDQSVQEEIDLRATEDDKRLIDRTPYDQITLNAENMNAVLRVFPLPEEELNNRTRIRIRLVLLPDRQFDVNRQNITKIETFVQLIYAEAQRLVRAQEFDEAFEYFDYLVKNAPRSQALNEEILAYLYANAGHEFAETGRYDQSLAILEELLRRAPNYRRTEVLQSLGRIAAALIQQYADAGDYRNARGLIVRLGQQYNESQVSALGEWSTKLADMAAEKKAAAQAMMDAGDFRAAERLAREMMRIWPTLEGGRELALEIAKRHSLVTVAVSDPSSYPDVHSIDNWAARRTGQLTQRTLLKFNGAGPEGGQYHCALGTVEQSDYRDKLYVELRRTEVEGERLVTGYDVSRRLLAMADPRSEFYVPTWASLITGVEVENVFNVTVNLRRPHVIPEGMLQITLNLPASSDDLLSPDQGPFVPLSDSDDEVRFAENLNYRFPKATHVKEIVERYYGDSQDAVSALRRRDVDVVEHLFPADAALLLGDESITVEPYALPTIHCLVPSGRNPFTANQTFRRAIAFGINRKLILTQELLGNEELSGCRPISGPFPIGVGDNDPLAYAYDERIEPRSYYPRLSVVLRDLAARELEEIAKKREEESPKFEELVFGFPGNEVARVAAQAIAQYLEVVGIKCRLKELPRGLTRDPDNECDLLYVQVAVWEPVIDARRLLSPEGVGSVENEYIGMALRRLDAAKTWPEARDRLFELHRICAEQLAVIPLWQTVDYFAYHDGVSGVGTRPISLYQNVEQWEVVPRTPRE